MVGSGNETRVVWESPVVTWLQIAHARPEQSEEAPAPALYTGLHIRCLHAGRGCMMRMPIMLYPSPFHYMHAHVHGLCMLCVSECVVVCHCFDMQSKSPAPECNVSLVGSHQARVTVNSGSTVTQPTVSPGLGRGVVITPLGTCQTVQSQNQQQIFVNPERHTNRIVPK